jgi:hypothetical protein
LILVETTNNIPPAVKHFAEVGRRYCTWAEGVFGESQEEIHRARLLLADLHLAAVQLPDLGIGKDIDAVHISEDEWSRIFQKFGRLPVSTYSDVFNPLKEKEPVTCNLADDLADIYRDIKGGLVLFDSRHPIDAAWEWRFGFQTHWGHHLLGAQRAIHEYLADEDL